MSNKSIRLIVGLGNIGDAYRGTRHNAGFHFVDEVADEYGARFQADRKFFGDVAKARIGGVEVILLKPSTLMNLSGKAVAAVSAFYKITPSEILVAHDELDLLPGTGQERAQNASFDGTNTSETLNAGSATYINKESLGKVVGMVSHDDVVHFLLLAHFFEPVVA